MAAPRRQPSADTVRKLKEAVNKELWERVIVLLQDHHFTYDLHNWAVQEAFMKAPEQRVGLFVPLCSREQLDSTLTHLVNRDMWSVVGVMLDSGVSEGERQRAVHEASWSADEIQFIAYFLPHCAHDQLTSVLTSLLKRGFWRAILTLLERNVKRVKLFSVLAKAATDANDPSVVEGVITRCEGEQLISVLTHLLSEGVSETAVKVLRGQQARRYEGPDFQRECVFLGEDSSLNHVLPDNAVLSQLPNFIQQGMCTDAGNVFQSNTTETRLSTAENAAKTSIKERIDSAMTFSVTQTLWDTVDKVLNGVFNKTEHKQGIEIHRKFAAVHRVSQHILQQCTYDPSHHTLQDMVTQNMWTVVGMVLQRVVNDRQLRYVVEQRAFQVRRIVENFSVHASDPDFYDCIMPFCNADQKDLVLTHLIKTAHWGIIYTVSQYIVSDEQHTLLAEKGIPHVTSHDLTQCTIYDGAYYQMDSVLTLLVKRELWNAVDEVIRKGVSDERQRWAVEEGSKRANDDDFLQYLMHHCTDDQLESVLTHLVTREMWNAVNKVLYRGVSGERQRWAVEEGSTHTSGIEFLKYLIHHCAVDQLESVLTHLANRELWQGDDKLIYKGVSGERRAVQEGSNYAKDDDFVQHLIHHCTGDQLEAVLSYLVHRELWNAVDKVIHKGVSGEQQRWAVEKGSKHAKDDDFVQYLMHHCTVAQLGSVLTNLVHRELWNTVDKVIHRGVSGKQQRWAVDEGSKHAKDDDFVQYLMHHCTVEQLGSVLTNLVHRELWNAVDKVIHKGVSGEQQRWAVEEASKHAKDDDFVQYIIQYCTDDQLEAVLLHVVKRELWNAVDKVILKGVSVEQQRWAVEEGSKHAKDDDFVQYLMHHCTDDQRDVVLANLVERNQWIATDKILQKGVRAECHRWAVEEASKHAKDDDFVRYLIHHCTVEQLGSVLTNLVHRELWNAVDKVILKGVSGEQQRWAVEEGSKHAKDDDFVQYLMHHCTDDQLEAVLSHLVNRELWNAVDKLIYRGVSVEQQRWAVEEASKHTSDIDFVQYLIHHCTDDQVEAVLSHLVNRELWNAVDKVIHRGVNGEQQRWAVEEGSQHANGDDFVRYLIHHCTVEQLGSVLTNLVHRELWNAVDKVIHRGVSGEQQRWAVEEGSKHAKDDDFVQYLIHHCADDQLDSVFTRLIKQGQWKAVDVLLQRGVSANRCKWAVEEVSKHAEGDDFIQYLMPHCSDGQLSSAFTQLVTRGLWNAVDKVLQKGIKDKRRTWALKEGSKHATNDDFLNYIMPHCNDYLLEYAAKQLVTRGMWYAVDKVLQRGSRNRWRRWAVNEGSKYATSDDFLQHLAPHIAHDLPEIVLTRLTKRNLWDTVSKLLHHKPSRRSWSHVFKRCTLPHDYPAVLPLLVEHEEWDFVQLLLHEVVTETLCFWKGKQVNVACNYQFVLLKCVESCRIDALSAARLFNVLHTCNVHDIASRLCLNFDLCTLLCTSLLDAVFVALCRDSSASTIDLSAIDRCVHNIYTKIIDYKRHGSANSAPNIHTHFKNALSELTVAREHLNKHSFDPISLFIRFLQQFILYYDCGRGEEDDDILLRIFAQLPLFPELQSAALRIMLRHKKWNVISQASLTHLWEEDRRQLLKAAVKQRQWNLVKKWADHTLYDDQRVWVINEAWNEKQWEIALLFADHGLTETELMRVHYRLAKHAVWEVVLPMFERGGDVAEVKERLWRMRERKRQIGNLADDILNKYKLAVKFEEQIRKNSPMDYQKACRRHDWTSVLYFLIRTPSASRILSTSSVRLTLTAAIKAKAWHVVIQLVRLGLDANHRDSLFLTMMRRQQWGVCRVLLEQRLSVKVCLKALPGLMEMNQWILVARVLEYDVDDAVRQQIMERAWERREGSMVWLCIRSSPTILSRTERERVFQRAFSCQLWQIIKPLVEFKDSTGFKHRDTTLLAAIEQHQWDMVDHCQLHHADINIKDEKGLTPLQRAAQREDWEAVEELVIRDGDPNLLVSRSEGVMHRTIKAKQWGIVKLLIEYQANIHMLARGATPLSLLIDHRKGELIEHSLIWCPGQAAKETTFGQTALHAACASGCWNSLYYLVARGVDPLAVTIMGQSVLVFAVMSKECPQRTVAECIKLGLSTHQPKLTGILSDLVPALVDFSRWQPDIPFQIKSPILCSVLRNLPKVTQILYDSGTCLYTELFALFTQLTTTADPNSKAGTYLLHELEDNQKEYNRLKVGIEGALPKLKEMATTPRSLVSTCRLVISHCLTLSKKRHSDIVQLPLLSPMLKNYLMFTDLADPQYPYL